MFGGTMQCSADIHLADAGAAQQDYVFPQAHSLVSEALAKLQRFVGTG